MAKRSPSLDMVETLLRDHQLPYSRKEQGKHIKLSFTHGGRTASVIVSCSVSDHRAIMNLYSDTRRIIKSLGVEFKENKSLRN